MTEAVQNTLRTFMLDGALFSPTGQSIPIELTRVDVPLDLIHPASSEGHSPSSILPKAPPRPPSRLPTPGSATLSGSLGEFIGDGRTGLVYTLSKTHISGINNPSGSNATMPPVILKFARPNRCADLNREAWFYEEMECLQGVALARCYGLYEADVPSSSQCSIRLPPNGWTVLDEEESPDKYVDAEQHPRLTELRERRDRLSVLVLERLGDGIPVGKPISSDVREDLMSLIDEIGHLGIRNCNDIRWANILRAPQPTPRQPTLGPGPSAHGTDSGIVLPSLVSPYTDRTHDWRIIDFELAEKTCQTTKYLRLQHHMWLKDILEGLPKGYVAGERVSE